MSSNGQLMLGTEPQDERPIREFAARAYLDYSMYVILDRALPHIGDGLKPVQRRIVYAMSELGLRAALGRDAGSVDDEGDGDDDGGGGGAVAAAGGGANRTRFKKSARTVGDVLGKFHPHGDTACYEAMVLLAQPFSTRYPLIDGQGNWGSTDDPRSFAAMRYTEARLTPFADVLLAELAQGGTDYKPNFDGTLEEPALLPARLPVVLLNGTTGIAVGMATDIPPHNLREVTAACVRLIEQPDATSAQLCEHIAGPDFPSGGEIITPREEFREIYATGAGTFRVRATWEREQRAAVVITALPHQVYCARVMEQIAGQMAERGLPMVEDIRDESDETNPVRIVLGLRSGRVDVEALMSHLFATTDLERTCRVNLNMIGLDGRPRVKDLATTLREWLEFRRGRLRRRLEFRLDQVETRLHRLEGILIAHLNIDEVIAIIREAEQPKAALMERFELTDVQATAILEIRLRQLAKLEEIRIRGEQEALKKERAGLKKRLRSKRLLDELMREELLADAELHGDERRTQMVAREPARALAREAVVASEPVTVVLSQRGWARAARGHQVDAEALSYRAGDEFLAAALGRSDQTAVFFDATGRAYSLAAHALPSARGQGEPLASRLDTPDGVEWRGVVMGTEEERFVLASDGGYGFTARFASLRSRQRAGRSVVRISGDGEQLLAPVATTDPSSDRLAVVSSAGHLLVYPVAELPELGQGKGVKLMGIPAKKLRERAETVQAVAVVASEERLVIHAGKRHLTLLPRELEEWTGERAHRGRLLPRGLRRVDRMVTMSERANGEEGAAAPAEEDAEADGGGAEDGNGR